MSAPRESEFATWHEEHPGPDRPDECTTHRFYLAGASGSVQFVYYAHDAGGAVARILGRRIQGVDVGYHSPVPRYDEQPPMMPGGESCDVFRGPLRGRQCFYDGSGLEAERWAQLLVDQDGRADEAAVYEDLAGYYARVFGEDVAGATPGVYRTQAEIWRSLREATAELAEADPDTFGNLAELALLRAKPADDQEVLEP